VDAPGIADFADYWLEELGGDQLLAVSASILQVGVMLLTDFFSDLTVDCLPIVASNVETRQYSAFVKTGHLLPPSARLATPP
jgi:hypothetical protein